MRPWGRHRYHASNTCHWISLRPAYGLPDASDTPRRPQYASDRAAAAWRPCGRSAPYPATRADDPDSSRGAAALKATPPGPGARSSSNAAIGQSSYVRRQFSGTAGPEQLSRVRGLRFLYGLLAAPLWMTALQSIRGQTNRRDCRPRCGAPLGCRICRLCPGAGRLCAGRDSGGLVERLARASS